MPVFLQDALVVGEDQIQGYYLAWFGGHGIHVYDLTGCEVAIFHVEATGQDDAPQYMIEHVIMASIADGVYTELIE
jgi:hypothetical protein